MSSTAAPQQALCAVCGQPGKLRSYGVVACSACDRFYYCHRTNPSDPCPTPQCLIPAPPYNMCMGCRWQKCFEVGMKHRAALDGKHCVGCGQPAVGFRYGALACSQCGEFFGRNIVAPPIPCGKPICHYACGPHGRCHGCHFAYCEKQGMSREASLRKRAAKAMNRPTANASPSKKAKVNQQTAPAPTPVAQVNQQAAPAPTPVAQVNQQAAPAPTPVPQVNQQAAPAPTPVPQVANPLANLLAHPDANLAIQLLTAMGNCRVCEYKADGIMGLIITCSPCRNIISASLLGNAFPICQAPATCAANWKTACDTCKQKKFTDNFQEYMNYNGARP